MRWLLIALGAFYVLGGFVAMRQLALERVLDMAISGITLKPPETRDTTRLRLLVTGSVIMFAGGLALLTLSWFAALLFTVSLVWQAGYLVWARRALPPENDDEAKGRQATTRAFYLYTVAWLVVITAYYTGELRPWPLRASSNTRMLVEIGAIAVLTGSAAVNMLHIRGKKGGADQGDGVETVSDGARRDFANGRDAYEPLPANFPMRVAPEYQAWPIWHDETGENLSPEEAHIPEELAVRIRAWDDVFQGTYRGDDPLQSGFTDPQEERAYREEGEAIIGELRRVHPGSVSVRWDKEWE